MQIKRDQKALANYDFMFERRFRVERLFIVHCGQNYYFRCSHVDNLWLSNWVYVKCIISIHTHKQTMERANTNVDMPKSNNEAAARCKPQTNMRLTGSMRPLRTCDWCARN
jgi:hypothetical protein